MAKKRPNTPKIELYQILENVKRLEVNEVRIVLDLCKKKLLKTPKKSTNSSDNLVYNDINIDNLRIR
jgi:hypothetical protein